MVFLSCAVSRFEVNDRTLPAMQKKVPGITMEQAQKGNALYASHCSTCHHLYDPSKYSNEQWDKVLISMFPKAKITDEEQQRLIRDFLHARSK